MLKILSRAHDSVGMGERLIGRGDGGLIHIMLLSNEDYYAQYYAFMMMYLE